MKFIKKYFEKFLKSYFLLPHIWVLIIILLFSCLFLILSIYYKDVNPFVSSIYANIFAGLLTGVVLSLMSSIKAISLYRTESQIKWLDKIHNECRKFLIESKKLYFQKKFESDVAKYDAVYDLLCLGNDISVIISQGQFNDTLPFNTYKYCKKKLNFDVIEQQDKNSLLRDDIIELESIIDSVDCRKLFKDMDDAIFKLNSSVLDKKRQLEIKVKAINLT